VDEEKREGEVGFDHGLSMGMGEANRGEMEDEAERENECEPLPFDHIVLACSASSRISNRDESGLDGDELMGVVAWKGVS
jgi:hypothetical protein